MAFRTPLYTVISLLLVAGFAVAALFTERWMKYSFNGVEAHIGILRYSVRADDGDYNLHWTPKLQCDNIEAEHDRWECRIFYRSSIALLVLTSLALLLAFFSIYKVVATADSIINRYFQLVVLLTTVVIVFLAVHDRARVPQEVHHRGVDTHRVMTILEADASITAQHSSGLGGSSQPVSHSNASPSFKYGYSFALAILSAASALSGLFYHMATCSKRKFEEL
eukprot:Sspe_Gene.12409::Locus_4229_Transcript_1_4_Confidence_0.333_Length_1647::g.12409::m.12409